MTKLAALLDPSVDPRRAPGHDRVYGPAIELELVGAPGAADAHRELTLQSIAAAVIVAAIHMGAAYPYMVLKLGFGPNVSIVSAFLGYLILSVHRPKS